MSINKSWFVLEDKIKKIAGFSYTDIQFTQALPEMFIKEYTQKGDVVFDPFAGFGTTLFAASKLGRVGVGVEYDEERVSYIKKTLKSPSKIINDSSLQLSKLDLPKIDLVFTSPPYMRYFDKENPLSNYNKLGSYKDYLSGINKICSQLKKIVKKNGYVVFEVSNTFDKDYPMTPLAWDVGKVISKYFYFERDFIFCFKNAKIKSTSANDKHSYCLLFKNI